MRFPSNVRHANWNLHFAYVQSFTSPQPSMTMRFFRLSLWKMRAARVTENIPFPHLIRWMDGWVNRRNRPNAIKTKTIKETNLHAIRLLNSITFHRDISWNVRYCTGIHTNSPFLCAREQSIQLFNTDISLSIYSHFQRVWQLWR